ncbi:MAG: sensor histidine kinase/response regulator [Phenylobacterium sp.]|nr:sensor histidine kinase/response regulator [Phenylobacterium sp.]
MSLPDFIFDRVTADIRQQMAGIAALTDQLARQRLTPDAQACVSGISEAADAVQRVLTAALDLRQVATDGLRLEAEPVRLRDLMDEVQDHWRAAAAMAGVTLLVSYDGDPEAAVVSDHVRLRQVFDGFIGEAVGGARRGAVEASLKAEAAGPGLRIEGRVRGARDATWHAQELEARVRDVAAQFGLEVALGVLLARQIVEDLGGRLTDETNPGAGHTVLFAMDLAKAAAAPEPVRATTSRSAHVLVVDDNATNRMVAQALCEMFDCTCEAASDGLEAVEAAKAGRFDLILMDIQMPGMDGVTAARAIRALPGPAGDVPNVALTANADPDDAAGYLAAGMDGVVEKPMKPEHLLAVLQQALSGMGDEAAVA